MSQIQWRPGIGDPTIVGWITVVMYFACAALCWQSARRSEKRRVWRVLAAVLALLGVNKQLDLQSLATDVARILARRQGWYEQRQLVQLFMILGLLVVGLASIVAILYASWKAGLEIKLAFVGLAFLIVFIVIRASSFHHVDRLLGVRLFNLRMNWILELGGLSIIMAGALRAIWLANRGEVADQDE